MSKKKKQKIEEPAASVTVKRRPATKWIAGVFILLAAIAGGYWFYSQRSAKSSQAKQQTVPTTPEALLDSLSKKDFAEAEKPVAEKLRKLLKEVNQNPSSAHAWGKLGMNLDVHDYKDEALLCYQKASELSPDDFRWPYYRAVALREKKSSEALTYFQKSLTLKDSNAAGHIRYGQALLDEKRFEEAGKEFLAALKIDPNSTHAYVGLARISLAQNQPRDAGSILRKAVEINPRHGEIYSLFSEVFTKLNEPQKAKEQLYIAQQLPRTIPLQDELISELIKEGVSSNFHYIRGRAWLSRGDFKNAEQEFVAAVAISPDSRYFDSLGVTYLYQKKFKEAIEAHRKAVSLNPKSVPSMNNLAAALYEAGQKEEAIQVLKDAIQKDPELIDSYQHLASLNSRSGNVRGAMDAYREGLKKSPGNPELSLQLGWLLATVSDASLRNGAEAVQLVEPITKKAPNAQTLDILAVAYAEAGQFDRAVAAEKQAISVARTKEGAEALKAHLKLFEAKRPYHE